MSLSLTVMELLKEQFMASQINNSQIQEGVLCIFEESQDPYADEDHMSTSSTDNLAEPEPIMEDFFDALIQIQSTKWKDKAKAKMLKVVLSFPAPKPGAFLVFAHNFINGFVTVTLSVTLYGFPILF